MTADHFLSLLSGVTSTTGGRYKALCPAHDDRSPSLSILPGQTAILLRCWAGCSPQDIVTAMRLTMHDLWYEGPIDKKAITAAREKKIKAFAERQRMGRRLDRLKQAELLVAERIGLDITAWSEARLERELTILADAYAILESDDRYLPFYDR
jgi:hypothetical protein